MKHILSTFGIFIILSLVLAACASTTPKPDTMMEEIPTEAMMEKTEEASMMEATPTHDSMMEEKTEETSMMEDKPADDSMMEDKPAEEAMMEPPAWFGATLTNVNTGETFTINDFKGKVILVENMAVWCSTCLAQQKQVKALHELLGMPADLVSVGLGIDPNESADQLKQYTNSQGFDWTYSIAPAEVAREISQLYGDQFLNPPSAPILLVDRKGNVHPLPLGLKSVEDLQGAIEPLLQDSM